MARILAFAEDPAERDGDERQIIVMSNAVRIFELMVHSSGHLGLPVGEVGDDLALRLDIK